MLKRRKIFLCNLKPAYSREEAKTMIDNILARYGETCKASFRRTDVEIIDSFKVKDPLIRHIICEIIARTDATSRKYENLSAEWLFHNIAYQMNVKKAAAKDVSLDYTGDPRLIVRFGTGIFEHFWIAVQKRLAMEIHK